MDRENEIKKIAEWYFRRASFGQFVELVLTADKYIVRKVLEEELLEFPLILLVKIYSSMRDIEETAALRLSIANKIKNGSIIFRDWTNTFNAIFVLNEEDPIHEAVCIASINGARDTQELRYLNQAWMQEYHIEKVSPIAMAIERKIKQFKITKDNIKSMHKACTPDTPLAIALEQMLSS